MNDLIDRQAAIDEIRKDVMGGLNYESILKRLPSAQPEPQWIPVSERLPEMPGWYLISKADDVFDAYFSLDEGWESEAFEEFRPVENVLAWMPMPAPYKEENR